MWIIKIFKIQCFYPPRILNKHMHLFFFTNSTQREHLFLFTNSALRELVSICTQSTATAINFPSIITLVQPVCAYCVPVPSIFHYKYIFMICALSEPTVKFSQFRSDNKHYYHIVYKIPLLLSNLQWEPENCGIWRRHLTRIFWCFVTTQMVLL